MDARLHDLSAEFKAEIDTNLRRAGEDGRGRVRCQEDEQ
jgi:hypothetical protein